jgi:hypothetical protein
MRYETDVRVDAGGKWWVWLITSFCGCVIVVAVLVTSGMSVIQVLDVIVGGPGEAGQVAIQEEAMTGGRMVSSVLEPKVADKIFGVSSSCAEGCSMQSTRRRPKALLHVNVGDRHILERWTRRRNTAQGLALRSRSVMRNASGVSKHKGGQRDRRHTMSGWQVGVALHRAGDRPLARRAAQQHPSPDQR